MTTNIEEILKGEHTDASANKAKALIGQIADPALQEQYNQKLVNRGKTKEQKAADEAARKLKLEKELKEANILFQKTKRFDDTKYVRKFKNGKDYLVRKETK